MPDIIVPFDGFSYHPHQAEAVAWMTAREAGAPFLCGGILADEMGLGKTWMTIGLLLNAPVANTLLLVPPVLQPQWSETLTKSGIPHRILGPPAKGPAAEIFRTVAVPSSAISVTLATYCRAAHNVDALGTYDRIVCDEGHIFRNGASTKTFRNIDKIPAERRWILSGTPVQNSAADFRNLLRFLHMDGEAIIRTPLATVAAAVLLRRTVADVRDVVTTMPAQKPAHEVVPVKMPAGSEEERVFQALVGRLESALDSHANDMIILELYLRIRQFTAHPDIYIDAMRRKFKERYQRGAWEGTASKMEAFRLMLATQPAEPTIVFTTFKGEMDLAETYLRAAGYETWSIRGGMSDEQRGRVTSESAALAATVGAKPVAIIVQIVAGGAGLNLQHCSRVCFLSSHWNPAVVDQAIARAYRMGQTKQVKVLHFLIADDADRNIDRRMAERHGVKRTVAVGIHPKLFCDSAIDDARVASCLDAVLDLVVTEEVDIDDAPEDPE